MSAIGVVAILRALPGKEAEFETIFAELAAAVNAEEAGNSYYRLFRAEETGVYKVLECYENQAALDAHRASDHYRNIGARLGPCLAGTPEVETLGAV